MLDSLADGNWPAWGLCYHILLDEGKRIIPLLDEQILIAQNQKEEMWEEHLMDLKMEILEK